MTESTQTFLLSEGFVQLEGLVGRDKQTRWYSTQGVLQIYILLSADAAISDVLEAIFQAGYQAHARMMKDKWQSFQELFTRALPLPSDLPQPPVPPL